MIISASRRTDIPAFYSEWFINRLKEGFVYTKNPMNPKQISKIKLNTKDVDCIVFWTKNVNPMLKYLGNIDDMGYKYYFQFTLNPYDKSIEKGLGNKDKIIEGFKRLSSKIGKEKVIWRYDPIILNNNFTVEYHLDSFYKLCTLIGDYTTKCIFSYVDLYEKTKHNAKGIIENEVDTENMNAIAEGFQKIAKCKNIVLQTCSEKIDLSKYGIQHAACIDKEIVEDIIGCPINVKKDKNQRQECGCIESIDIGSYNCCLNGCIYCYATLNEDIAYGNRKKHNPKSPLLIGELLQEDKIIDRKITSLRNIQVSLF
ncbi:DUF1848 domain-containing protein [Clostridium chromiireducens]|uniref:DUF1848 domain-containing protein n=1 Tax=Clostridium chromiireducens TaxID=225345 RepID=UPI003AF6EA0D